MHADGETAVELWDDGTRHVHIVRLHSYDDSKVPPIPSAPDLAFGTKTVTMEHGVTFIADRKPEVPPELV